jgi:hypothetical protein
LKRNRKPFVSLLSHLLVAATLAAATDKVVFTIVDRVQFSVPGDWPIIASQSTPEKTVFAFQIPNQADEGTADSTNLAIVSSQLKDAKDREEFNKKAATPEHGAVEKTLVDGWVCRSFTAMQGKTQYVDWDCFRAVADCGIFVRMAWPHLLRNPKDYDKRMESVLSDVLTSVVPSKKSP